MIKTAAQFLSNLSGKESKNTYSSAKNTTVRRNRGIVEIYPAKSFFCSVFKRSQEELVDMCGVRAQIPEGACL